MLMNRWSAAGCLALFLAFAAASPALAAKATAQYGLNAKAVGATQQFDSFRTELANQVSRRAALIGETGYCAVMVPLVVRTPTLSDAEVRGVLADDVALHLARKPPCTAFGPTLPGAAKIQ